MQEEIWKDVIGYEGLYKVSNLGRVKSLSRLKESRNYNGKYSFNTKEIILSPGKDGGGYLRCALTDSNHVRKTHKVHRLVAYAFLNLKNVQVVNHIDFNRANNNVNNLECCTSKENTQYSRDNNRYPKMKQSENHKCILKEANSIKVICLDTNVVYDSISDAAKELGYKKSTLIHYLIGSRKNKTSLRYLTQEKN